MTVVGITGHQSIPRSALAFVEESISAVLDGLSEDLTGVTALAEGADQLFAEILLEKGGHLHAVIPCANYEASFRQGKPREHFLRLLAQADSVETLDSACCSEAAFLAAGQQVVDLSEVLIAVWDGRPARGLGGTADIVAYAEEREVQLLVVWPPDAIR